MVERVVANTDVVCEDVEDDDDEDDLGGISPFDVVEVDEVVD